MKKIIATFLFMAFAAAVFGQYSFDLGIKAGLNNSKITVNSEDFTSSTINNFHFGAFARINLDRVYIQPEAYYSSKGGNIDYILSSNPLQTVSEFNYDMIDVPILFGVNIINKKAFKFRAMGGPLFSFITNNSIETQDIKFSTDYFKDRFFGWQYGLGIDVLFLTFDARIENSAGHIYSSDYLNARNKTLLLTLGIKIL
jgi:hypothetical protein